MHLIAVSIEFQRPHRLYLASVLFHGVYLTFLEIIYFGMFCTFTCIS